MMKKRIILFSSIFSLLIGGRAFAQCNMYELPLSQKVEKTSDIFEGKVISKNCFWNAQHSLIFTSNIIEVYKIFKGNIVNAEVEIITEGGMIGDEMHNVEPNLNLSEGDIGIFMVEPTPISNPLYVQNGIPVFKCYGNAQGFFKYDTVTKTATVPFKKYNDIPNELYQPITYLIGETYRVIKSFDFNQQSIDTRHSFEKSGGSISGFSPTTITAGTNSILTIDGAGFGASRGSSFVNFKNADDGGLTYIQIPSVSQYISWSDTQIQVKVPEKAGTGTIRVVVGGVTILTSSTSLTVSYAEKNSTSVAIPYQTDLVDLNTLGGITWQMNTAFDSNTPAKNAFNRAMQTWSCNTQINWIVGPTTSKNIIAYDSVNVVRFDSGAELPAGTLARCYYYWLGCLTSVWFVSELDMAVDDGTAWEYGPAAPTGALYDFETVMLHELGHGHQLAHVIDNTDLMHYSTPNGVSKRTLNINNSAGGSDVMSRSFVANSCGPGPMTPSSLSADAAFTYTVNIDTATFTNTSSNATSYGWNFGDSNTATTTNPTHIYLVATTYPVTLTATNSCGSNSITQNIPILSVGINKYLNNNVFLTYPNPTSGSITIELPTETKNTTINVFNYLGEMVASINQNNGSKKLNLDLSNLANGVYCIVGNVNGKVISKNIVLVK